MNTHFFANKYDYRKEWGELSGYSPSPSTRSRSFTSRPRLSSTACISASSPSSSGTARSSGAVTPSLPASNLSIGEDEPLIAYLERNHSFLRKTPRGPDDTLWETIVTGHQDLLDRSRIELAVAMMVENRLIGFIAVGRENPGTPYGRDDIDLLAAIASQSSAALMSARFAQELAVNKEVNAFNRMSSYVLHDLKNAAGNLSLILQNAPNHMESEEFRADMIETISQTLGRIDKVMSRLGALPSKEELSRETIPVGDLIGLLLSKLDPRLEKLTVTTSVEPGLTVRQTGT